MDAIKPSSDASLYSNTQKLKSLKNHNDLESLKVVAKEFESLFIQMALKSMRDANKVLESGMFSSNAQDAYQDMYDKQLAKEMSQKGSMGLAKMVVSQMGKRLSEVQPDANTPALSQYRPGPTLQMANPVERIAQDLDQGPRTPKQFVTEIWPYAKAAGAALGVDPKVIVAQAALESAWGQKSSGDNPQANFNLFGIKADKNYSGPKAIRTTLEYEQGQKRVEQANFRVYDSIKASVSDYVDFLQSNPRYQNLKEGGLSPQKFIGGLKNAGYATDPNYVQKVMRVFNSPTLSKALDGLDLV